MSALTYWLLVGASAVFLILFILWNTDSFGSAKPCISAAVCAAICFFCVMFTSFTYWDSPSRFQSLSNTYKELQDVYFAAIAPLARTFSPTVTAF